MSSSVPKCVQGTLASLAEGGDPEKWNSCTSPHQLLCLVLLVVKNGVNICVFKAHQLPYLMVGILNSGRDC